MSQKKLESRRRRKERVRKKISGTSERPRLSVFRSVDHFYAQLINDEDGKTLLGASTLAKDFGARKDGGNVKGAKELGKLLAEKALSQKITDVVFDRSGFLYHGRVKAFADGAREGGLKF